MKIAKLVLACSCIATLAGGVSAQSFVQVSSTEGCIWQQTTGKLQKKGEGAIDLAITGQEEATVFKAWGTCFNELGWDALNTISGTEKEGILKKLFSTQDDLRFTLGRFSMNANDYARDWYSCDEVSGDFQLKHFNINRDKKTLIPFIKAALRYNPNMSFWASPWSPPSWMKINNYYSVRSDKHVNQMLPESEIALYEDNTEKNHQVFPQQLAVNDYMIQDPRYLQTYADYFCKFIDAYKKEGIPIGMVMFQNEAWSYTNYPGCAWTAQGIIRFNTEYLSPTLKKHHPEVALYLGTINTNRYDVIDQILSDSRMNNTIQGVGFQWEGGQILSSIRKKYPQYKYVQTESECGWGSFDWKTGEHTFNLINHYLGNGCEEYTFWNAILCDDGVSGWGWKQNALIRVDTKTASITYTPEYYAVKHYSHYIAPGAKLLKNDFGKESKKPIMIYLTPENRYVVIAGNFKDKPQTLNIKLGNKHLNAKLSPHSFNTFQVK